MGSVDRVGYFKVDYIFNLLKSHEEIFSSLINETMLLKSINFQVREMYSKHLLNESPMDNMESIFNNDKHSR